LFSDQQKTFAHWRADVLDTVELALDAALPAADTSPIRLHHAMRYAVLQGGKRVRPLLVFAAGEVADADRSRLATAAVAVELIHAYSLVHDDLPCMDDDVLRRGKPTVHVQFDETTALLAGDALQSLAFRVLSQTPSTGLVAAAATEAIQQLLQVHVLAEASGSRGMAGGQAIDLASVGVQLGLQELELMHRAKTGALLRAAILLGANNGRILTAPEHCALEHYAYAVGLAFQVIDDILDVTQTSEKLGKSAGKDAAAHKATYPSVLGLEKSRAEAGRLTRQAHAALRPLGKKAETLRALANYLLEREY
jgi:farnesyl diphosphate synthase